MKKLAIFVEGLTEQLFAAKLLKEIAGDKNIYIEEQKARKTINGNRSFVVINASARYSDQKYYVLIRDCGGDSTVQSDIRDSCENLAKKKYQKIIGLRDVFPSPASSIRKIEAALTYKMPTKHLPIHIILAVMEVEAWFLAENNHLTKIHPSLTTELVKRNLALDLLSIDVEKIKHPAGVLNNIYKIVGYAYGKNKRSIKRTVRALDCSLIYLDLKDKVKSLGKFIKQIDSFLS